MLFPQSKYLLCHPSSRMKNYHFRPVVMLFTYSKISTDPKKNKENITSFILLLGGHNRKHRYLKRPVIKVLY